MSYFVSLRTTVHSAIALNQVKIADTIDVFYGAADRMSDGAIAAAAYKRSTEELDAVTTGNMVCPNTHRGRMLKTIDS